jgi:hypothetical protein
MSRDTSRNIQKVRKSAEQRNSDTPANSNRNSGRERNTRSGREELRYSVLFNGRNSFWLNDLYERGSV